MAGSVLYGPYSILMIIGLISLLAVSWFKKRRRAAPIVLLITMPVFIFFQIYFWNMPFNNYVQSYLFASHSFECEYEDELKDVPILLPKRTVLTGKQNVCSPFYATFVKVDDFKTFYQDELTALKNMGTIQKFDYMEREDHNGIENKVYRVELFSGSRLEILFENIDDTKRIAIEYLPSIQK